MSGSLTTGVLEACARAGVREFCVCAGARNVALVVALQRSVGCRVFHFFDERSAAFFALGRMMGCGRPVAVVTTSGTAVAELLPAAVEAYYQSLPLVMLTADRPPRFRGSGAPQAVEQVGIFTRYGRSLDVCEDADGVEAFLQAEVCRGRPAHVNVCSEEPLAEELAALGAADFRDVERAVAEPSPDPGDRELLEFFLEDRGGLMVMLGNLREDERLGLDGFLRRLGAPILAEAGSGLREKLAGLVVREPVDGVRRVLRIGGVPSSRFWRDLEGRMDVKVMSVSRGRFAGLARGCEVIAAVDWRSLDVGGGEDAKSGEPPDLDFGIGSEPGWFRFLSQAIPAGSQVLIGNSLPIREWNMAATFEDRGLRCFSCRGANGIDGALSVFFGLSEGDAESWAIVGDLTALYDLSAPWVLPQLSAGRRRLVVINNGGGRIFSRLPALADLADGERRVIENDHGVSLGHWAAMWGMGYVRVVEPADFLVEGDSVVIEIVPQPAATDAFWKSNP